MISNKIIAKKIILNGFDVEDRLNNISVGDIDLSGYIETEELQNYAKKSDIPDLSSYAKRSELPVIPEHDIYALKDDIPVLPNLELYAKKTDIPVIPDHSIYATKTEIPDTSQYVKNNDMIQYIDNILDDYVTSAEADVDYLETQNSITDALIEAKQYTDEEISKIPGTGTSAVENDIDEVKQLMDNLVNNINVALDDFSNVNIKLENVLTTIDSVQNSVQELDDKVKLIQSDVCTLKLSNQ